MPKVAAYTLAWSPSHHTYRLFESQRNVALDVVPGSPAWLVEVSSFAFAGQAGSYTARKEAAQRGDRYWYAYLRIGQKLSKKYLGKTADLTLARLEEVAGVLHADRATAASTRELAPAPPAQHEVALPHALSHKHGDPLNPQSSTKLHQPRTRVQLVARSHLVQRLRQGVRGALTLVSAPAGFGKTTLLAQWLAERDMPVVSTVAQILSQTWTQTVRAALLPSACPAFLPPSRRLWEQMLSLRAGRLGRAPCGPTLAPPPCSCLLTCRRAWPGSAGLPSPGFSPTTCSRRGRDGPVLKHCPPHEQLALPSWVCAVANATPEKTSDGH
jgi:LuxR family transcriptional regulator, maltose regulon positive regulatory protein